MIQESGNVQNLFSSEIQEMLSFKTQYSKMSSRGFLILHVHIYQVRPETRFWHRGNISYLCEIYHRVSSVSFSDTTGAQYRAGRCRLLRGGGLIFSIVKNHNKISQDPYCNLYLHHCIIIKYSPIRIHIHSLEVGKLTNNSNSSRDYHVKFLYQDLHLYLMTELIPHILYST